MADSTKRHWLRFSLRGMLLVTTGLAVWIGWNAKVVRERKSAAVELELSGVSLFTRTQRERNAEGDPIATAELHNVPQVSLIRRLLGDVAVLSLFFPEPTSDAEIDAALEVFPEAQTMKAPYIFLGMPKK